MRMPIKGRPFSGFTLVELMVTLAVATILLVLATPSFVDMIDKSRLKGVVDNSVDFIKDARAESVKHNRNVSVAFGGTTTAWCVGAKAAGESGVTAGDLIPAVTACDCDGGPSACTVGGQQKVIASGANNGVGISTDPTSLPTIEFDGRLGTVKGLTSTAATFSSPRKMFDLKMTVTPLGQVSLCVPSTSKRAMSGYPSCS